MTIINDGPDYEVQNGSDVSTGGMRRFEFKASVGVSPTPRMELVVTPKGRSESWVGDFFGPPDGADIVGQTPDSRVMLIVAGGVAYWVPADNPEDFKVVGSADIRSVHWIAHADLVFLASRCDVEAYNRAGHRVWLTRSIVTDGFDEVRVAESVVVVRGFSAARGHDLEVTLDASSGAIVHVN